MHCFTSCWRLVDGREDSLDLASRVSSILLELCELEVFLLSWPGQSQPSSPGSSLRNYSSGRSRSCPCHCIGGLFLWLAVMWTYEKSSLYSGNHKNSKKLFGFCNGIQNEKYWPIKKFTFFPRRWFSSKKKSMASRRNRTLWKLKQIGICGRTWLHVNSYLW